MNKKRYKQVDDKVELCIEPTLEPEFKKIFAKEMSEGEREILEDGRIHYIFKVSDEKAYLLQKVSGILRYNDNIPGEN
jgi:hypothetical protein